MHIEEVKSLSALRKILIRSTKIRTKIFIIIITEKKSNPMQITVKKKEENVNQFHSCNSSRKDCDLVHHVVRDKCNQ